MPKRVLRLRRKNKIGLWKKFDSKVAKRKKTIEKGINKSWLDTK